MREPSSLTIQHQGPAAIQDPRSLTTDEVRFFRYTGFLKLPWRLPAEMVEAVQKQATDQIERGRAAP